MDDFKPFYFLILIPLSVILIYFSFKTIILLIILAVTVICGPNVVNGTNFVNFVNANFNLNSKNSSKVIKKKNISSPKKKRVNDKTALGAKYSDKDMPSVVKLTPGKVKTPVKRNQSFVSSSPFLRTAIINHSGILNEQSDNQISPSQQSFTSSYSSPKPFLPTIKRALGLSEYSPREDRPRVYPAYGSHPSNPSPGFIPAVRLVKRGKANISQHKGSAARSPSVVRIAPPEPYKLSSPRLFHIQTSSNEARRTPDTQAVIQALKEKSLKRSYGGYEHETSFTEYPVQQAKRRRQDSQQSTSSTSSLPPLPDSLPDLSSTGYTIPRLETPTLKRSAMIDDWDDSCSAKKLRKDGRLNSILSSLSSSQRLAEKEKQVKRKVSISENKENKAKLAKNDSDSSFSLNRSDTVILPVDTNKDMSPISTGTPIKNKAPVNLSEVTDKPKLEKKITLNESFSARKRQMSLYSGLNKSFQKVPHANVIASMEDYENDMGAEKKRVEDMLEGIHEAETEKEKEKEKKEAEEKAQALKAAAVAIATVQPTTAPVASVQPTTSLPQISAISTAASTLTTSGITKTTSSPLKFNFATVKSSSPSKTTQSGLTGLTTNTTSSVGLVSSTSSNTMTSTGLNVSSGFSLGSQPSGAVPTGILSGVQGSTQSTATTTAGLNLGSNTTPSIGSSGFSFGTQSAVSTTTTSTPAPFNFGTAAPSSTSSAAPSGFSFGVAPTPSSTVATTSTPFGAQSQSTTPFSTTPFGTTQPTQPQSTATFGTAQPQPAASFGVQPQTTATTTGTNPAPSTFNFKSFGSTPSQPVQGTTQASIFGQQPPTGTFGAGSSAVAPTPSFGQTTTTAGAATGGFNFGASAPSFGQPSAQKTTTANTGFSAGAPAFGSATQQPGFPSTNSFGAQTNAAATFGQAGSIFGTAKTASFGPSPSGFGGTTANATPSVGGFGQSTASFGPPKTTAGSSFGTATPSFGQGGASSFGQTTTTTASSGFGTTFGTATPSFGAPKTTASSTFGSTGPTFGSATTQAGSTTGFSFGATSTQNPPANASFNFGSTQNAPPSTPNNKGGFNFSAASTPANNGGFNFSANASFGTPTGPPTPVFGTPTAGTPNMFTPGAPGGVPKPRVAQRGRRRATRGR